MREHVGTIWSWTVGERRRYGAAVAAMVAGSAAMYLVPLVPQVVIDGVLAADPEAASPVTQTIVEWVGGRQRLADHLWMAAAAMALFAAVAGTLAYLRGRWAAEASENIVRRLRDRLFDHLQRLPAAYYDDAQTGDLVQRCTSDVDTFRRFLSTQIVEISRAVLMFVVPLPLMLAIDQRMTWVSVALVLPTVVFSFFYFRRIRNVFQSADEAEGRLTATLQENLTGIRVVRAFARQDYEIDKFAERNATYRRLDRRLYGLVAGFWSLTDLFCAAQTGLVLGFGGYWLATGAVAAGTFYFFLAAVNLFVWPMRMMGRILTELSKASVAIGRISAILDEPVEEDPAPASVSGTTLAKVEGARVAFDRVSFAYGRESVLKDVSFTAEPGQTVALMGPSGAGKSTLIQLLLRLRDPNAGRIELDGVDIGCLPRRTVRREIAVVMQEPFLYAKTVGENIRLGRMGASAAEVSDAAMIASIHHTIQEFEDGYETLVGERGVTLSGGQRQRVALARALLGEARLMVLDDALSAVDTGTEALILKALEERRGRQTTLVIAHRLSTLVHADQILVMDRGRVVQSGAHHQLVTEHGLYRRLWQIQNDLEEADRGAGALAQGE